MNDNDWGFAIGDLGDPLSDIMDWMIPPYPDWGRARQNNDDPRVREDGEYELDKIEIEYVEKGLEENTLLKLKELFEVCKVVSINVEELGSAANGYVLVDLKFARNGKVGG
jgi:hypothetical protein